MKITTYIDGHGFFSCTAHDLDRMIAKYLPNSVAGLRAVAGEVTHCDYRDVHTVTELLVILVDAKHA